MKTTPPSRTADQFVIRLPEGMRQQIAAAAASNNRSMNAELVARLQDSLAGPTAAKSLLTGELLDELIARLGDRVQVLIGPVDENAQ